ncbi:hypothetical protein JZ751_016193 [Albula glossodonta]|uniref:Uncharacterized protein n=1 Tax=Albula glossodonta TaxID=121402 RepID=A0A8T2MXY8_9TELE|nr:hypothetical protein JZ751_016193 [Albula glossodonta]
MLPEISRVIVAAFLSVPERNTRRGTPGERAGGTDTQSARPDPQDEIYTGLNLADVSPVYDTLNHEKHSQ